MTDNGPQFDNGVYINFFHEIKIKNLYSTLWYPLSNGKAETSNKTLLTALKRRLHLTKRKWEDELPGVLWAYRTTIQKPTGVSPFVLTYGMEAVIPTKIGVPMLRIEILEKANIETISKDLDLIDELHETTAVHITSY